MHRLKTANSAVVSYDLYGSGPPLVLAHGSFSDHVTEWRFIRPILEDRFSMYPVARRGRGETDATEGHSVEDEARDLIGVLEAIGQPVFLLGHSYGAHVALVASAMAPERVRKLVLYEPLWPNVLTQDAVASLEGVLDATGSWEAFTLAFFRDSLLVPEEELDALHGTETLADYVRDAKASLGDIRALASYSFQPSRFGTLDFPVLLQFGTESPRDLYVTDALASSLKNPQVDDLAGQAHEAMTTAPDLYAHSVIRFLLNGVS